MEFARIVFLLAGIYGLLLSTPIYFMEKQNQARHAARHSCVIGFPPFLDL